MYEPFIHRQTMTPKAINPNQTSSYCRPIAGEAGIIAFPAKSGYRSLTLEALRRWRMDAIELLEARQPTQKIKKQIKIIPAQPSGVIEKKRQASKLWI